MQIIILKRTCEDGSQCGLASKKKIFQGEPNRNGGNAPHNMCSQDI